MPGGVTQQQLNYLIIPAGFTQTNREYMAQATANGDLGQYGIKLPSANSDVKVAVGMDWRAGLATTCSRASRRNMA